VEYNQLNLSKTEVNPLKMRIRCNVKNINKLRKDVRHEMVE
jgi:hypothetical protein